MIPKPLKNSLSGYQSPSLAMRLLESFISKEVISPPLPIDQNYISIATSGGRRSSQMGEAERIQLKQRQLASAEGLSKEQTAESMKVVEDESENVSEQPRPDIRQTGSSNGCDKRVKQIPRQPILNKSSHNYTSTVSGSAIRNELLSANKSSIKRSSVAIPAMKVDSTMVISYTHRDDTSSDKKHQLQLSMNRRKRLRHNSPSPDSSSLTKSLNISSKSKLSSIKKSKSSTKVKDLITQARLNYQ